MTEVRVRVEMYQAGVPPSAPAIGFRAYAPDIGVSAEGTNLETVIAQIETAIGTYLGESVTLSWVRAEMKFRTSP